MKLCWFDEWRLGLAEGTDIVDVSEALTKLPLDPYPRLEGDRLFANLPLIADAIIDASKNGKRHPIDAVTLRSPVARPTKILGTPANYLDHVQEADAQPEVFTKRYRGKIEEQGLFLKAISALAGPGDGICRRFPHRLTHHEMELAVIIGRLADRVSEHEALSHVAGYAIGLDMTVRGPEDRSFRKSIDSYAVLGPWCVTADEIPDPMNLDFSLSVNGAVRQASNTRLMIMDVAQQITWASSFYTLWPGDVLMTGTCEGVGPVSPGDVIHCEIERIGPMTVRVR